MKYALDELIGLIKKIVEPTDANDPVIRYVCSLMAELAYCHVPNDEFDTWNRAKIIPCEIYNSIIESRKATDIQLAFGPEGRESFFVAVDRGVISLGYKLDKYLFVAFRGTSFLYDWLINLRIVPIQIKSNVRYRTRRSKEDFYIFRRSHRGLYHPGFAEEALRISLVISKKFDYFFRDVEHVFYSGHSLGGAVAAIAAGLLSNSGDYSTHIIGAPRYCDTSAYYSGITNIPVQIMRRGDIVPTVPPRGLGYADHPIQVDTQGFQFKQKRASAALPYLIWESMLFLGLAAKPHAMDIYRRELGATAGAQMAAAPLVDLDTLR